MLKTRMSHVTDILEKYLWSRAESTVCGDCHVCKDQWDLWIGQKFDAEIEEHNMAIVKVDRQVYTE